MLATCVKDHPFEQARLPIDVLYETREDSYYSHGNYAKLLECRVPNAFDIVREHVSKEHQR